MSEPRGAAVVTGAAGAIGRAIAEHLASAGWALALVDLDRERLEAVSVAIAARAAERTRRGEAASVTVHVADVGDEAAVRALAVDVQQVHPGLRALVNNAGIGGVGEPIDDVTLDAWNEMIRVDLTAVFLTCRAFAPALRASGRGRVVNLGSVSAEIGVAGSTAYTAAKGGVVAFSKSLARELAPHRVTVNVVAPGVIDTPMARRRGIDHQRHLVPWHRIGRPDDIAPAVAYLLSDEAEFMTGQALRLNGGAAM